MSIGRIKAILPDAVLRITSIAMKYCLPLLVVEWLGVTSSSWPILLKNSKFE